MQQTMKVISDTNIIDSARLNARVFFTPTCCSVVLTTSVAPSITPKYAREQRIRELLVVAPELTIIGLPISHVERWHQKNHL